MKNKNKELKKKRMELAKMRSKATCSQSTKMDERKKISMQNIKTKLAELARVQLYLDRLEFVLDKQKRYLLAREAEIALAVWEQNRKHKDKLLVRGLIEAEVTRKFAKDENLYRKMKRHNKLRRKLINLNYEKAMLEVEIGYLDKNRWF